MSHSKTSFRERLEPDIPLTAQDAALVSIAISLKRIADAIESGKLADAIQTAIGQGINSGAQEAIYWWRQSR